jgi:AcrR family transcriptional regulator
MSLDQGAIDRQARQAAREAARKASHDAREAAREAAQVAREAARKAGQAAREARRHGGHEDDTRTRIQRIALELFTENGYEATSLREIAERLGVTKAALYYHFKTKDEIIESLVADRMAKIEELVAWGESQPRTLETRQELLRRYSIMLYEQGNHDLMRFFERNQSSMAQHKVGGPMRARMSGLHGILVDRDAPIRDQIRGSLAIFALHSTWFTVRDTHASEEEKREVALEVALELIQ